MVKDDKKRQKAEGGRDCPPHYHNFLHICFFSFVSDTARPSTKRKIPLQVISYENLGNISKLKWSASNIALQIFSKLGGIPWLVKSDNKTLILGIGSAHKIVDDEIKKYFAYTVCLDSSGLYKKVEILSSSDNEEDYLTRLRIKLRELLNNPNFSSFNKCALHIPFKIKYQ